MDFSFDATQYEPLYDIGGAVAPDTTREDVATSPQNRSQAPFSPDPDPTYCQPVSRLSGDSEADSGDPTASPASRYREYLDAQTVPAGCRVVRLSIPSAGPHQDDGRRVDFDFIEDAHGRNVGIYINRIYDGYTDEEKELIAYWFPKTYGKYSEHVENHVTTPESAIRHGREEGSLLAKKARDEERKTSKERAAQRRERLQQQSERDVAFSIAYNEWTAQCAERKNRIKEVEVELSNAVNAMREAKLQWEAYYSGLRAQRDAIRQRLNDVKAEPVPPRPSKNDY